MTWADLQLGRGRVGHAGRCSGVGVLYPDTRALVLPRDHLHTTSCEQSVTVCEFIFSEDEKTEKVNGLKPTRNNIKENDTFKDVP